MEPGWDEKAVFLAALGLPPEDRPAFLRGACPDDAARTRIETLLLHHSGAQTGLPLQPPARSAPDATPPPVQIDEFRILGRIGEGGMGVVYLAEDTVLGRQVALKVLASHLTGSEQALSRFREEARSAAALKHSAIVPVFRFGFDGKNHYIVSEYVSGPTLAAVISQEHDSRSSTVRTQDLREWHRRGARVVATIADALDCSHRAGIIHRDVKPSNILLDLERGPRLTDFGIAKHLTEEARTNPTAAIGSCHYMSPEQASIARTQVDQRSDIFSLGVVLYEVLSLRRPFDGPDVNQVLRAVVADEPPRLRSFDRLIHRDLETICHKALEKSPTRRYQTAAHMAADLRCFLEHKPILARPPRTGRRLVRWANQHRTAALAVVLVVLVLCLGAAGVVIRRQLDASLAWVSVDVGAEPCAGYLQTHESDTFRPANVLRTLGRTPLATLKLLPGQYRLTIVRQTDRAFCEFNLVLIDTGPIHIRRIRAVDATDSARSRLAPGEMVGVLRRAEDAAEGGMMLVAGDTFELRRPAASHPILQAPATTDTFLIDKAEVSNREYKDFVDATRRAPPYHWAAFGYSDAIADLPVMWVTFEDAEAYARWRGKRLPTALEWQAAARGPLGDLYPTGDAAQAIPDSKPEPDSIADPRELFESYLAGVSPVHLPAAWDATGRPLHTFSNVRELTGTVDFTKRDVFVVGRAWCDDPGRRTLADVLTATLQFPASRHGFRCAKSILSSITEVP